MGAGYHTRGSHGQLARWRCPANSSTEVRRLVGTLLLAIFKEEMDSKARSSSVPRGSSDMSGKIFYKCVQYFSDYIAFDSYEFYRR